VVRVRQAAAGVAAAGEGDDAMNLRPHFLRQGMPMNLRQFFVAVAFAVAAFALLAPGSGALAADAPAKKGPPQIVQTAYATPDEAGRALFDAMKTEDLKRIYTILGRGSGKLIYTGDKVADNETRDLFVAAYDKSAKFDRQGDTATLLVGANDYPFPFPLVKKPQGWMFDAHAGAEEIVNRRVGENELSAIQTCLAFVDAQREYVLKDRDRNGLLEYAQKFVSSPGKQDGLYWPTAAGEPPSPLGPLAADAAQQGYTAERANAYRGYKWKVLTAQGKDAPGGAYDYIVNGRMIGGFAFAAWPARWGVSGVMSFMCNYEGVVYQKNLGRDTAAVAAAMTAYNPDSSWTKAAP